jgi:hypothetical protein
MPHGDVASVREAKRRGLVCLPGVATPTEAFAALDAGADGLKMFPAEQLSPAVLKAWRAVLPRGTLVFPVGGIRPDNGPIPMMIDMDRWAVPKSESCCLMRRGGATGRVLAAAVMPDPLSVARGCRTVGR